MRQFVNNASHGQSSPVTEHINVDGVSCLRKSFESYKLSSKTTDIILASWRHGTKTQYSTYIRKWTLYCREQQIDTLQCSLSHMLGFLTDLYEKHMSYSGINSARSALSAMGIVRMSYSSINSARSVLSAMGIVRMSYSSINSARSVLSAMGIVRMSYSSINSARSVLSAMGIVRMSYSSINSARSALSAMGIVRMSYSSINSARSALSAMGIVRMSYSSIN